MIRVVLQYLHIMVALTRSLSHSAQSMDCVLHGSVYHFLSLFCGLPMIGLCFGIDVPVVFWDGAIIVITYI